MFWYLGLCTLFTILYIIWNIFDRKRQGKIVLIIYIFLILWVFAAFRDEMVGADTRNYLTLFAQIKNLGFKNLFSRNIKSASGTYYIEYETGFKLLVYTIKFLLPFISQYGILGLIAFLILFLIFNTICKNTKYSFTATWLYLTLGFFQTSLNMQQNALAIAIVLYGTTYIKNKQLYKWLLVIFIATFVHLSSILFLPMYWMNGIKWNKKKFVILIFVSVVIALTYTNLLKYIIRFIPVQYYSYVSTDRQALSQLAVFVVHIILVYIACGFRYGKFILDDDSPIYKPVFFNFFVIESVFYILAFSAAGLLRVATLFSPAIIVFIPQIIENTEEKRKRKTLVLIFFVAFAFYVMRLMVNNIGETQPYIFRAW